MSFNFVQIKTIVDLISIEDQWNSLLRGSDQNVPFLSFEWILAWWNAFGQDKTLYVHMLEDDSGPIGIAPMYLVRQGTFVYLQFIGGDRSDYLDFIVPCRHRKTFLEELFKILGTNQADWDVALLKNIRWDVDQKACFDSAVRQAELSAINRPYIDAPYIEINGDWESFLKSKSIAKKIRKKEKRLSKYGNYKIEKFSNISEEVEGVSLFEIMKDIERKSWKYLQGNPRLQTDKNAENFFYNLLKSFCCKELVDIWLLQDDGIAKAYAINFKFNNKIFAYNSGYDDAFKKHGVGALLHIHRLRDAFEKSFDEYDFLRGNESYKDEWTKDRRNIEEYALFGRRFKSTIILKNLLLIRWNLAKIDTLKDIKYKLVCYVNKRKMN